MPVSITRKPYVGRDIRQSLTSRSAIHTYQNKGTTARSARPRDHVIVYSEGRQPSLVPGEDRSIRDRDPIKVNMDPKGEPLNAAARLNLAKIYTIEHNIPIFPVGKISSKDIEKIRGYCSKIQGISFANALPDVSEDEEENEEDNN
jgi:hypothetical protein